jgi:hypothetical protein
MVLDSLCFRQIWPPHTKAAAISGSVRHLSRVRVTDSGHGRNETANSAAATAGRRAYARPGGFQVAAATGWPGAGYSRQDSRTAPATSVWPAVADGFTAKHAPQAYWLGLGGRGADTGAAGRGALRLQSLVSLQCRVIGEPYSDQRRAPQATTACQERVSGQSVRAAAGRRVYAGSGGFLFMFARRGGPGRGISR